MTKKTTRSTAEKRAGAGRPTKYDSAICPTVTKYCLLGVTDEELADFLDITVSTLYLWKNEHPEFSEAIKAGKEEADANIADSLYHRAKGYQHPETHFATVGGVVVATPTTKHYPPDTAAAFIWLKNRRSGKWRDKQEHEHSGPNGGPIETKEIGDRELARRIAFTLSAATRKQATKTK